MKIKAKLLTGLGALFAMIILLTVLSSIFINRLSRETANILVANYNSLDYARKMNIAVNEGLGKPENITVFSDNLEKQLNNITEPGEKELTENLKTHFQQLAKYHHDSLLLQQVRKDISEIVIVNMQAIQKKSQIATSSASNAVFWITLIGSVCFIVALTMLFNLPGNIANPIKEFTESIREIADRNYSKRIHFTKNDEFGQLAKSFNTMAEKLEEYQASSLQKLMIEKKRIETLINNMNDPVIGLDENKKVLFMNNTALAISGLKTEEVIGKPIQDIAMKNDLIRSLIQEMFSDNPTGEQSHSPVKIYANNKESYFEKEIIPIKIIPTGEQAEKLIGNVILLQNITTYKELDFAKTNFIATVSHELKTPISSIKMSVDLLNNEKIGSLNSEQLSLVQSIQDDAGRLLKITGELLNMTQVETGSILLSALPTPPAEIVQDAVNSNKMFAENKSIYMKTIIPESLPDVLADKEKTIWVLTNLISNAIRYSYEDSEVTLELKRENNTIRFSVQDGGQGIAPQYINKVFDRYFRIPGTRKEGTGLGLSISKEFIEAQGGSISVISEFGKGSTFTFELPVA